MHGPQTHRPGTAQNTRGLLKVVAYAVAILLVAACGSSSTAAKQSPGASPSASDSTSPAPSPSASPVPVAHYGVLVTVGSSAAALLPQPVSTSNTRLYFLDQSGNVNFLSPNGVTGVSTHVPTGASIRSMFTVSPDDQRIAVVENTYNATGATTVLYIEDLNGGTNHAKVFTETGAYTLWPIGWHGTGNLVVAKVPSCTQGGGPTCCGPQELHVVDPATAGRRFTLGGSSCIPVGSATPAGALCENSAFNQVHVLSWTGATVQTYPIQGPTPAYLSPDGTRVALVVDNAATFAGQSYDLNANTTPGNFCEMAYRTNDSTDSAESFYLERLNSGPWNVTSGTGTQIVFEATKNHRKHGTVDVAVKDGYTEITIDYYSP